MAKLWKNMCKNLRESMLKNCAQKSGKNFIHTNNVDKNSYSQSFSNNFHVVFNMVFTSVKMWVFHVFHIAYYYNY